MYKVYSVESRKGGVGKTTIALNLSKALIDEGYNVLLIDCDITGTPITNAASNSPFWKNYVTPIILNNSGNNLIQFFEDEYLKGLNIQNVISEKKGLEKGMIHMIGTDIYKKDGKPIIDPRLLMDDLHTHWFVEMLREISEKFNDLFEDDNTAIVLDNSPGYMSVSKSIRKWLTSIGNDHSHFLLVSSLDEQDVDSIISMAIDIDRLMCGKWRIANLHSHLSDNPDGVKGLAELLDENPEFEDFFYYLREGNEYQSDIEKSPSIKNYISIILNKVPSIYRDDNIGYQIKKEGSQEREKIINALFPINKNGMPVNVIEYDTSISGQFIESNIYTSTAEEERKNALFKAYDSFGMSIKKYEENKDKVKQYLLLNNSFGVFKSELIKLGYKSLIESMGEDLVNQKHIHELSSFIMTLGNVVLTEKKGVVHSKELIQEKDAKKLKKFMEENGLIQYSSLINSLYDFIYSKAGFNRKRANWHLLVNLSLQFRLFLLVQSNRFKKGHKTTYVKFLFREYEDIKENPIVVNNSVWKNDIMKDYSFITSVKEVEDFYKEIFPEFYKKMCYTLLRLCDCAQDYQIIINSCKTTIMRGGRTMDGDLVDYLKSVVLWKTETYNSVFFETLKNKPFEMMAVMNSIKKWCLNNKKS